jgi:hypothetical protein
MHLGSRAVFGVSQYKISDVILRSQSMSSGFTAHPTDYPSLPLGMPAFQALIANLVDSQQDVSKRTVGMAALRNEQRDLLWTGMNTQRVYVQSLADAAPARAVSLILNAGLLLASVPARTKPLLSLALGKQPGTVLCDANVGLLIGAGSPKPNQGRFLSWEYTLDGKTFLPAGSTPNGKTVITNLPPLTLVGVRVALTNRSGQGKWSAVETIATIR